MKTIIKTIVFLFIISMNAQVAPILDHTWSIEKIVDENEIIMADLNESGNYDQFAFYTQYEIDNDLFYSFGIGSCAGYVYFGTNEQYLYFHLTGCTLSEGSSEIASYFYFSFIQESDEVTLDNELVSFAFGPFSYEFRYEGDIIYLDITNTEGDVATFWTSTLSNNNFDNTQFSLYPNPITNKLYIENEEVNIEQVEIYNLSGKQVLRVDFEKDQPIDVSFLSKGMYFVKLQTEDGSLTKKLIKN